MPHIVFNKKEIIKTPQTVDGVEFKFCAKSYNLTQHHRKTEYKVGVQYQNRDYLLTLKDKNDDLMLKADKITRVTPVDLVKTGLNAYAKAVDANVVFTNANGIKLNEESKDSCLKEIEHFVKDFNTDREIQIEVGFGSGRHLLHQAAKNPDVLFIGIEIHTPSIEQMLKQVEILGLTNVLAINYDARLFMEFIKSNSVGKIFVHFPVPWDKKPHRRVYSNEFINEALRVLKVDGSLELRTDSRKYFDYCTSLLTNLPQGRIIIDINKDLEVISKYEDRWRKQGKNIYDVVLKCSQEDEEKIIESDFSFEDINGFDSIKDKLISKPIVEKDYFLHIEDVFVTEDDIILLQLTFGNFNRPLSKYIIIENNKVSYYQGSPIPTSANISAHKHIKKILCND